VTGEKKEGRIHSSKLKRGKGFWIAGEYGRKPLIREGWEKGLCHDGKENEEKKSEPTTHEIGRNIEKSKGLQGWKPIRPEKKPKRAKKGGEFDRDVWFKENRKEKPRSAEGGKKKESKQGENERLAEGGSR